MSPGSQVGTWQIPAEPVHRPQQRPSITATLPPAVRHAFRPTSPAPQDGAGPAAVIVTLTERPVERARAGEHAPVRGRESRRERSRAITGVVPYGGSESAPGQVTILGSGFTGATEVTFGGVPATRLHGDEPVRNHRHPARLLGRDRVRAAAHTGVTRARTPTNDICQVQVQVTNPHGASATGQDPAAATRVRCRLLAGRLWSPARLRLRDRAGADRVRLRPRRRPSPRSPPRPRTRSPRQREGRHA